MAFYHYSISKYKISSLKGQIPELKSDFKHYENKSFGEGVIYYKITAGELTDIVIESVLDEADARKEVIEVLENLG